MNRLARSMFVAIAFTGAMTSAKAVTLTPEQQEIVRKYNISASDQKKLFGTQTAALAPARAESPARAGAAAPARAGAARTSAPADTGMGNFLENTTVFAHGEVYKSIGERLTNINGGNGALTNGMGGVVGFNTGFGFGESPIRFQVGASHGTYDLRGRLGIVTQESAGTERHNMITAGIYKRGDMLYGRDPISWGVVYDHLEVNDWGINSNNIKLDQVRGVIGYAFNHSTEIGIWGAHRLNSDDAAVTVAGAPGVRREVRAMNQANLYLKHNFSTGAQVTAYAGLLDNSSVGNWQLGLMAKAPLNNNWSVYSNMNYVVPASASPGPNGSALEQFSISFGLAFSLGGKAVSPSVTGHRGTPLLDVANNGSFLITD